MSNVKNRMTRSISMPVKPKYLDEEKSLERSEEKEMLFSAHDIDQIEEVDEQDENFADEGNVCRRASHHEFPHNLERKSSQEHQQEQHNEMHPDEHGGDSNHTHRNGSKMETAIHSPCIYEEPDKFQFTYPHRVISSSGQQNIKFTKIPKRLWQYFKDLVTTTVEWKWRYTITLFISGYFIVWYLCTAIWYLIAEAHGDLSFNETTGERLNDGEQTCVKGGDTFTGLFIYTMETHTSIGFGERYPTDECPEGVFFYAAQLILYIGVEGMLISIVYMKVAKPSRQIAKPKFSKRAVVCLRDGRHCLVIRICDRNEQQIIGTKVTVYLLQNKSTLEGEFIQKSPIKLTIEGDGNPCLLWPTTICHVINKKSPFYKYTAADFARKEFEIIVSCTGTSASTGQFTECLASYVPNEIYWGEQFTNIIHYNWKRGWYVVDYDNFDKTVSVGMPVYSAHQFHQMLKAARKKSREQK